MTDLSHLDALQVRLSHERANKKLLVYVRIFIWGMTWGVLLSIGIVYLVKHGYIS